ncbi:hypothetical protein T439DRAFT_336638 [Meredithblackwellia eburnea MCA 4105]
MLTHVYAASLCPLTNLSKSRLTLASSPREDGYQLHGWKSQAAQLHKWVNNIILLGLSDAWTELSRLHRSKEAAKQTRFFAQHASRSHAVTSHPTQSVVKGIGGMSEEEFKMTSKRLIVIDEGEEDEENRPIPTGLGHPAKERQGQRTASSVRWEEGDDLPTPSVHRALRRTLLSQSDWSSLYPSTDSLSTTSVFPETPQTSKSRRSFDWENESPLESSLPGNGSNEPWVPTSPSGGGRSNETVRALTNSTAMEAEEQDEQMGNVFYSQGHPNSSFIQLSGLTPSDAGADPSPSNSRFELAVRVDTPPPNFFPLPLLSPPSLPTKLQYSKTKIKKGLLRGPRMGLGCEGLTSEEVKRCLQLEVDSGFFVWEHLDFPEHETEPGTEGEYYTAPAPKMKLQEAGLGENLFQ